ncbi:MAG: hypothetical protein JXB03_09525 [Spirochaetales bacterium]|nr:hypothetical protein [Spirochaetales bacterium]
MKQVCILTLCVCLLLPVFSQEKNAPDLLSVPQIGILDVISDSFSDSERSMFTDILRTEIFKMQYFRIIERGMIQQILNEHEISLSGLTDDSQLLKIGEFLAVEKLLVCKAETFADTIAINLRVIDVNTSLLDYTENVFIQDRNQMFQALAEIAIKLELHYISSTGTLDPEKKIELMTKNWIFLGADEEDIPVLIRENIDVKDFLAVRQFDITFSVKDYLKIRSEGWDIDSLKEFFREGISFAEIQKALSLGIGDLKNYREAFKTRGIDFDQYLDAYTNHIVSADDYLEYRKGYIRDYLHLGAGGVANDLPVMNSEFKFFLLHAGWEHYLSKFQRHTFKYSLEMGANFMQAIIPSPYFQLNCYAGAHPFYAKLSAGVLGEVFLGGHFGAYAMAGVELNSTVEFSVMATFLGTQPRVSYADFETEEDDPEYVDIVFPYFGAFLTYKWNARELPFQF